MIFVTVGTQPQQFRRLFAEVEHIVENNFLKERVVAQCGNNEIKSKKIECFDYIELDKVKTIIQDARLVISHGGTGSIITALKMGKKVIGVPRLAKFGEHVNDHQSDLIRVLSDNKMIIPLWNIEDLYDTIIQSEKFIPNKFISGSQYILDDVKNYIDNNY